MGKFFGYEQYSLGQLLGEELLQVPPIQRGYDWDRFGAGGGKVGALLQDLFEYFSDKEKEVRKFYAMNDLIFYKPIKPEKKYDYELLDGQQRLMTLSMVLAAIRDELASRGEGLGKWKSEAEAYLNPIVLDIDRLLHREIRGSDGIKRLRPVLQTWERYEADRLGLELVRTRRSQRVVPDPFENKIWANFVYILNSINSWLEEAGGDAEGQFDRLELFGEILREDLAFTATVFWSLHEAIQAFNTTNTRGKPLSVYHLLRFSMIREATKCGADSQAAEEIVLEAWENISGELLDAQANPEERSEEAEFIMRMWQGRRGERIGKSEIISLVDRDV
jgi:hypothetical protein